MTGDLMAVSVVCNVVFGANPEPILASGVVLSAQVLKLARPVAGGVH